MGVPRSIDSRMGRNKVKLKTKEPKEQMPVYNERKLGFAKKARDLSILCDIPLVSLSFNPHGKADLVLGSNTNFEDLVSSFIAASSKERYGTQLEGIKALQKKFKGNSDHEINVQQLMNLGRDGTSHAIQKGQQSSVNMTHEEIKQWQHLLALLENIDQGHMINSIEQLKLAEAAIECLIHLNTTNMMEMFSLRDRVSASTSAFQHFTNQVAMNHLGPLNGNMMNQGTNLLQPNMDLGSNSDPVSDDLLMAAPPGPDDQSLYDNHDGASEEGFGASAPGN